MTTTTVPQTKKKNTRIERLYQWHIRVSLLALLLAVLWAFGGLVYTFQNKFDGGVAHTTSKEFPLVAQLPGLSLQEVMVQNELRSLRNFRLVEMEGKSYYQIRDSYNRLQYFDAETGKVLHDGDLLYSAYLARYFAQEYDAPLSMHLQKDFDRQYQESNRLLPVYKVSFERANAVDVYVETEYSRLAAYHTLADKTIIWLYSNFHQGAFFGSSSPVWVRLSFQIIVGGILLFSVLSGFLVYGLRWPHYRHQSLMFNHHRFNKYQRQIGLVVSLIIVVFACSLIFQAFTKQAPDNRLRFVKNSIYKLDALQWDSKQLPWKRTQAHTASIINMPQGNFYQLFGKDTEGNARTYYFSAENGKEMEEGDLIYARYLANKFKAHKANIDAGVSFSCCLPPDTIPDGTQLKEAGINATALITQFDEEYEATNKRLPVVRVSYASPGVNYYIETSSSRLSLIVEEPPIAEIRIYGTVTRHFLDAWEDKKFREAGRSFFAFSFLSVSLLGFTLYLKHPFQTSKQ